MTGIRYYLIVALIGIPLMINDVGHCFMTFGHFYIFGKMSIQVLCLFLVRLSVSLVLSCIYSSYNLHINPLLDILFETIFFHTVGCHLVLLMVSFAMYDLNFSIVPLDYFYFYFPCLRRYTHKYKFINKYVANDDIKEITACLVLRFMISDVIFTSLSFLSFFL